MDGVVYNFCLAAHQCTTTVYSEGKYPGLRSRGLEGPYRVNKLMITLQLHFCNNRLYFDGRW